jgi:hypothetical protein
MTHTPHTPHIPHTPTPPHTPHPTHTPHIFFIKNKKIQKVPKFKIYYAKWTLRIEVVNGKKNIYYCNFRVYFVTRPIEAGSWGTLSKKIKKNVILMCVMGSCIKVVKQKNWFSTEKKSFLL